MKFRISATTIVLLLIIPVFQLQAQKRCPGNIGWTDFGRYKQMAGGSEFAVIHRPDIADSAYEFFYRLNDANYAYKRIVSPLITFTISNGYQAELVLTDSCGGRFHIVDTFDMTIHLPNIGRYISDTIHQNPYTGYPNTASIHQNCSGLPADTITRLNGEFTWFPMDTMTYQREYWYSKIIYLPYTCGKWQIHRYPGGVSFPPTTTSNYPQIDTSTNMRFDCIPNTYATTPPYVYVYGGNDSVHMLSHYPLIQFSNLVSNQMPHYLSQLDYRCPINKWTSIPLNAVDPDGDSLVFSASPGNAVGWATSYRGQDAAQYGEILPFYAHTQYNMTTLQWDTLALQMDTLWDGYQCIPGSANQFPNCVTYNHVNNPFDCDSTYSVDPQTGEIRFFSKTVGQHVYVTVRVDEYRNNNWLSTNFRLIRLHTVDSGYVSNPQLVIDTPNVQQATITGPREFTTCSGAQIQIPFDVIEPQSVGNLTITDNHATNIPTSTMAYTNNNSDSVRGVLTWQTLPTDSGWYSVVLHIVDSACSVSQYIHQSYEVIKIFVSPNPATIVQVNACNDTTINSTYYDSTGLYTQHFTASDGCDSTVKIDLTIINVDTAVNYGPNNSLLANAAVATYQWIDCGTMTPIPGANTISFLPNQTGWYACIVSQQGCSDTSGCYQIIIAPDAVNDYNMVSRLYPNPSKGSYQLELDKNYKNVQLEIRTINGQLIWQKQYAQLKETSLELEAASGVYMLIIKQDNATQVQRLMKW